MTFDTADAPLNGELSYSFRPSLLGAPWEFRLTAGGMDWSAGNRSGRMRYRDVRRVRLSFKPAGLQTQRFLTEIWAEGAPRMQISSTSWKSMVEQERLDDAYAAFVGELHARIAESAPTRAVRFDRGTNPFAYWPGLVLYVLVALGLLAVIMRALELHTIGAAAFVGAFVALFLWHGANFFRRNWPGTYRPDALPEQLLPRLSRRPPATSG